MESNRPVRVSPEMLLALREALPPGEDTLSLESFIQRALYHPEAGYYRKSGERVGRAPTTDFYTASSLGSLFPQLIVAAIESLLGETWREHVFIEFGPETGKGILGNLPDPPFNEIRLIRPGEPFDIPKKAIVFSNELFDAQPFRRFVYADGKWLESAIKLDGDELVPLLIEPRGSLPDLPEIAPEGYLIDWPSQANHLLRCITGQPWNGLFLALDYGLDRSVVMRERPQGTGRTYSRHQMGTDLLQNAGQCDITCHVIWDELETILHESQFHQVELARQEAFFMRRAQSVIKAVLEKEPAGFSERKQTLMELLHPGNMGHKFQVLSAVRGDF